MPSASKRVTGTAYGLASSTYPLFLFCYARMRGVPCCIECRSKYVPVHCGCISSAIEIGKNCRAGRGWNENGDFSAGKICVNVTVLQEANY